MKALRFHNIFFVSQGSIGDLLMALPILERISVEVGARVTVLGTRNIALLRDIAAPYASVKVRPLSFSSVPALLGAVMHRNFFVIPPSFGPISVVFPLLGWIVTRMPGGRLIGFDDPGQNGKRFAMLLDDAVPFSLSALFFDNLKGMLSASRVSAQGLVPQYRYIPHNDVLHRLNLTAGQYLVAHLFAANPKRSFPPFRWQALLREVRARYPHLPVVLTGSDTDAASALEITKDLPGTYIRAFGLPFQSLATVIAAARAYMGPDTGTTHLASVLGVPSVVIGNLTNPTWLPAYAPRSIILTEDAHCLCRGDKSGDCTYFIEGKTYLRCMIDIKDESVLEALARALAS